VAEESGNYKLQVSIKVGNDMLNIRADSISELDALTSSVVESENPLLSIFKSNAKTSDTQRAANVVQGNFPGSTAGPETPNCTQCGGRTAPKVVNLKKGGSVTVFECQQEKGTCNNDKGFPFAIWPAKNKGRDA